jgi:cytochrome P450
MAHSIAREMGTDIGLFLAEGAEWRRMRTMVAAGLSARQLRAYFPSLRRVALRLRDRWACAAAAGPRSISMPTRNAIRSMSSPVSPSGRM